MTKQFTLSIKNENILKENKAENQIKYKLMQKKFKMITIPDFSEAD